MTRDADKSAPVTRHVHIHLPPIPPGYELAVVGECITIRRPVDVISGAPMRFEIVCDGALDDGDHIVVGAS